MPAAKPRPENELRAERYLGRVGALQSEMTCQLQHLRALREREKAAPERNTLLRLRQVRLHIEQLRARQHSAQREVTYALARLPSPRARTMMEMRYLSGLTWEEIARAMHISPRSVLRMHQRALRLVDILLSEQAEQA